MARSSGPIVRTEAGRKKWEKDKKKGLADNSGRDPWGEEMGERINRVRVVLKKEGVDGERLVRSKVEFDPRSKISTNDGLFPCPFPPLYYTRLKSTRCVLFY